MAFRGTKIADSSITTGRGTDDSHPEVVSDGSGEFRIASEPSLERLFEIAPDAMIVANRDGKIVLVNNEAERLFGYSRDELRGQEVEILMPERFRSRHVGYRADYSKEPRLRPMGAGMALYAVTKDGREFPVEIRLAAIETANGLLVSTTIRDVTERQRLEVLRSELGFERLISELSAKFINLPSDEVDAEIRNGLRRIVEECGTDQCVLSEVDIETGALMVTHSWQLDGIPPPSDRRMKEQFPWVYAELSAGRVASVERLEDLPVEAVTEAAFLKRTGMKSALNVPLVVGRRLIGCLSLCSFSHEERWDPVTTSRLQKLGNVFANALERKRDNERLRAAYAEISDLKERLELENLYLREEIMLEHNHHGIVGQSAAILSVLKKAEQVAATDSAVLITGETGTGKELIGRTIHELSRRKDKAMVKVNCAAMPASLVESEFFGREKGAYTGALSREIGRFELADRSTIFLDEIGELPIELQAKLLRVLQEGEFERLGSPRTVKVDVRVIAATNRNLQDAVREGKFREDLFYRLSVFPIEVPALRQHKEDLPALVWHILRNLCKRMGRNVESIHPATLKAFEAYSWPGNVRELSNLIERYLILNPGRVFKAEVPAFVEAASQGRTLDDVERRHIEEVLQETSWRVRGKGGAAEILGVKPTTLEAKMKKLDINRPS